MQTLGLQSKGTKLFVPEVKEVVSKHNFSILLSLKHYFAPQTICFDRSVASIDVNFRKRQLHWRLRWSAYDAKAKGTQKILGSNRRC